MNTITNPEDAFAALASQYPDKTISASSSFDNYGGRQGGSWSVTVFLTEDDCVSGDGKSFDEAMKALADKVANYDPAKYLRAEAAKLGMKLVPA